jgi:hypothetical protein
MGEAMQTSGREGLRGFVTERHFAMAEEEFPGISSFYAACSPKPFTFLDLLARFHSVLEETSRCEAGAP